MAAAVTMAAAAAPAVTMAAAAVTMAAAAVATPVARAAAAVATLAAAAAPPVPVATLAAAAAVPFADPPRRDRPREPELRGPDDPHRKRRLAWAVLFRRTWGLDVLDCSRCGDRMELLASIEDPDVAAKILRHLNLPTRAPPRRRPWRPALALDGSAGADHDGVDAPSAFE
jgi:hypothetical protein